MLTLTACKDNELTPSKTDPELELSQRASRIEARLPEYEQKAAVIHSARITTKNVALCLESPGESSAAISVLDLLDFYRIKATFVLSGEYIENNMDIAAEIVHRGHMIANNAYSGEEAIDTQPAMRQITTIYKAQMIIDELVSNASAAKMAKLNSTAATEELRKVLHSCGIGYLIRPDAYFNSFSFKGEIETHDTMALLGPGSVLSIKLNGDLSADEHIDFGSLLEQAQSAAADTEIPEGEEAEGANEAEATRPPARTGEELLPTDSADERTLKIAGWIIEYYIENGYSFVSPAVIYDENEAEIMGSVSELSQVTLEDASYVTQMWTTLPAVALTFDHLSTDEDTIATLGLLKELGITASFFLSGKEITERSALVKRIHSEGHSIYPTGYSGTNMGRYSAEEAFDEIIKGITAVKEITGEKVRFFRAPGAVATDNIKLACAAAGVAFAGYSSNPTSVYDPINQTMEDVFVHGLQRGDVITMRLDDDHILEFIQRAYDVVVTETTYRFATLEELFDGQYTRLSADEIEGFYDVGINLDYDSKQSTKGFKLDKIDVGRERVAFITFDDWGSDKTITKILNELEKYDVKASFFIIGERAENNPNLVRAIAEAGHDIANHTNRHIVGLNMEPLEAQEDLVACYTTLALAIGRVPELYYRVPGLNQNAADPNAIRAAGYEYWLNSNVSTEDYWRTPKEVLTFVKESFSNGDMIILHMSDNSCGQDAIGLLVDYFRGRGYTLAKISDYLENDE